MSTVWIRHPETQGVAEVPKDTLPQYRQSGWQELPDDERAAMEEQAAAERAKETDRIEKLAAKALNAEPTMAVPDAPPDEEPPAPKGGRKKENG